MDSATYRGARDAWRCPRPRRYERGQTIVEFALVIPIVLLLLFATLELGMFYKTHSAYQEAAQEAVRVAAAAGNAGDATSQNADAQALAQLKSMLPREDLTAIQSVTIYDATVGGDFYINPPSLTDHAHTDYVYRNGAFVCAIANPGGLLQGQGPPCDSGSYWDPTVRNTGVGALDHIGVRIVYKTRGVTGILPTLTITQTATTVMEPFAYGQ